MRVRAELVVLLVLVLAATAAGSPQTSATSTNRTPRRTGSIAGRIIHPEGAAADGARIAVYAVVEDAPGAIVATATSGYDGRYEVNGLAAGTFMVGVTPLKGGGFGGEVKRPPVPPVETLYPGVLERERAVPVTVFDGVPTEGIDVWLAPAPQRFSISGRIYWPEGVEVERVTIEYGGPAAIRRGTWYVYDPGGLFTIEGVGQETYVLLARGETASGPLIGIASTTVGVGSVEDMRVVLRAPGTLEGHVVTEAGAALPATALRVMATQTLLRLSPLYPTEAVAVGDQGRFTIEHLAGHYALGVEGLPPGWRVKRIVRNGVAAADAITVGAGERVTGIEIVVGHGST
jgi:hypothetical protein